MKRIMIKTAAAGAAAVIAALLLAGCGTVTYTQGLSLASALWRVGSGIFSPAKSGEKAKTPQDAGKDVETDRPECVK